MELTNMVNSILFYGTLIAQVIILFLVIGIILSSRVKQQSKITKFFGDNALVLTFIVALGATIGSLVYSNIIGFEPCLLCWYQRIFLFPQVIILFIALIKKDRDILNYILWLSIIGALIAVFQYYTQVGGSALGVCAPDDVSCSQRYVFGLGYITIVMMSLTTFVMQIALVLTQKISRR